LAALIKNADRALYQAKQDGKNTFQFYTPKLGEVEHQRLELETQLGRALERGELALHYQPQFDLRTGALAGVEALLRWNHPQLGLVPPASFLPIAEHNGLIVPIGAWTLRTACRQARELERAGLGRLRVAVNVSGLQFAHPGFTELVVGAVEEAGIEPNLLELELTESMVMRELDESAPRMSKLRALGVRISLDDFGAGYSSLGNLQRLPIDCLKINQSFVRELGDHAKTPLLVESIVALAQGLGVWATAGGVESQTQLNVLQATGCDGAQGYLFGRPLPAEELLSSILRSPTNGRPRSFVIMPPPKINGGQARDGCHPLPCLIEQPANTHGLGLTVV
jgi:EAL domain-containing protein (putative c-di-GMP-specific phosphodiesterase class I)